MRRPTEEQIVRAAAKRWGLRDPTPDDIIMRVCPRYHADPDDTARYHRLARQVITLCSRRHDGVD